SWKEAKGSGASPNDLEPFAVGCPNTPARSAARSTPQVADQVRRRPLPSYLRTAGRTASTGHPCASDRATQFSLLLSKTSSSIADQRVRSTVLRPALLRAEDRGADFCGPAE